jgi:hypothetical protein
MAAPPSVLSCPCDAERVAALKTLSKLLTHADRIKLSPSFRAMAAVPAIAVLVAVSAILRVEVALMEGWCSVEELVRWGFGHAPVVMANEAHDGLTRCVRTRETGIRMIRAAHEAGVRRLAMEALPWPARALRGRSRLSRQPLAATWLSLTCGS